jgi:hypothetical protein
MNSRISLNSIVIIASLVLFAPQQAVAQAAPDGNNGVYSSPDTSDNFVESVRVNDIEILPLWDSCDRGVVRLSALPDFLLTEGRVTEGAIITTDDNCHYGRKFYQLTVEYAGRRIFVTMPSDEPGNRGIVSIFPVKQSKNQPQDEYSTPIVLPSENFSDYKKYNFGGSVQFYWDDPARFTDVVLVGNQPVRLGMSLDQFKETFPKSREYLFKDGVEISGEKAFIVGIGSGEVTNYVIFTFRDGKLVKFGLDAEVP